MSPRTTTAGTGNGKLTYEDYCRLPDDARRYEILDGELVVSPSPTTTHQIVLANLHEILRRHVRRRRLGVLLFAPVDVILADTSVVVPDLVFVAEARRETVTRRALEGPPDLVVEVLSPSTGRRDRTSKAALYTRYGIAHYWLVDPVRHNVESRERSGSKYRVTDRLVDGGRFRPSIFPGLEIDLAKLWSES